MQGPRPIDALRGNYGDQVEKKEKEQESTSFLSRVFSGEIAYQAVAARKANQFEKDAAKIKFMEDIIERKQEFGDEDKLIIKKAEIRVLQKY